MPVLVTAIHVFAGPKRVVDGRDEPGHDARAIFAMPEPRFTADSRIAFGARARSAAPVNRLLVGCGRRPSRWQTA